MKKNETSLSEKIAENLEHVDEPAPLKRLRKKAKPTVETVDTVEALRLLVNQHIAMTKAKVAIAHMSTDRKNHVTGETIECRLPFGVRANLVSVSDTFKAEATKIEREMLRHLKNVPIYQAFLKNVAGCGTISSAYIVTKLSMGDVSRKPSAIRKYCGLAVIDGKSDRHRKGETGSFSTVMRTQLYLMAMQGMRMPAGKKKSSKYLDIWRDAKARKLNSEHVVDGKINGRSAKMYADAYGRRKMLDVFLEDLYIVWRTLEGLPVWPSYYAAKLGYAHGGKISVNEPKHLALDEALELVGNVGFYERIVAEDELPGNDIDDAEEIGAAE